MSAREPLRPELPDDDVPSPEVLDELLRAFAADSQQQARLDEIDLTSREVAELLTPTPRGDEEPADAPVDAATDTATDTAIDTAEPEPSEPLEQDRAEPSGPLDDVDDADVAVVDDVADGDEPDGDEPDGDSSAPAAAGAEADAEPPAAAEGEGDAVRVAGDPFLGGAPMDEVAEAPEPPGPRTISIVDEGLPDSVYLGGNLEPSDTNRSRVVIEERDAGAIISVADASSATHIEPRLQDRRKAVKKAASRKRLKWGVLVTTIVLLIVAALAVLGSGLFAIEEVRVQGAERTDPQALAGVIADLEGTPVLRADTDAAERELERLPWVEDARVTTDFPDAATIELRERTPAAVFETEDGEWRLVDDQGRVLEILEEQPDGYLPIRGAGFPEFTVGQFGPPGLSAAATLARSLTPAVAARASEITVAPNGSDLRLHLTPGVEVRFGAADELVQKLVRLETKLHDLGGEHVNYIDVSTNEVGQG